MTSRSTVMMNSWQGCIRQCSCQLYHHVECMESAGRERQVESRRARVFAVALSIHGPPVIVCYSILIVENL
jgi:hypothetical protein